MVRTRIAPSPTGEDLHIGNLYTALFNWAFARKNNGQFIVRIEDTDQKRLIKGSEERILKTLQDFGLDYHEGGRQSERLDIYKKYAEELVTKGHAYYCDCSSERLQQLREEAVKQKKTPMYDRHCRELNLKAGASSVIRMKIPADTKITIKDLVRGEIIIDSNTLDDQVILKSDGFPTYHLAVVVDDHLMEISHVIRGEEWISSTPKHLLLYEFFGWELPIYVHIPLLRNADKSKLSKRKHPVWSSWYLQQGFLPEAVLNYLALMGWSHPEEKEIFSLEEFVKVIDLTRLSTVGPIFDIKKLEWMNGEYIRLMSSDELAKKITEFFGKEYSTDIIKKTAPIIQERIKTIKEYDEYCRFFIDAPKKYEIDLAEYKESLIKVTGALEKIAEQKWQADQIGEAMQAVAKESGLSFSKFFMAIRVGITGKKVTPPLNESIEILGKAETLKRLAESTK